MKRNSIRIISAICGFCAVAVGLTQKIDRFSFSSIPVMEPKARMSISTADYGQTLSFAPVNKTMYVKSNAVAVKKQPNDESEPIFSLDYADFISVTGDDNDSSYGWIQVELNGETGYIQSDYLSDDMLFYESNDTMYINQNFVSDSGVNFYRNQEVVKTGYNNDYFQIMLDGIPHIIPNDKLSDTTQPNPQIGINYNYIVGDEYIPVIEKAYSLIGTPYGHGYSESVTDCVGLTLMCYEAAGIDLPWALSQAYCGVSVPYEDAVPGDIIVWAPLGSSYISHVGIYVGEGKMIHASSTRGVIAVDVNNYIRYGGNMLDVRHIAL